MKTLKLALGLLAFHSVGAMAADDIKCLDQMSFAAGQIHVKEVGNEVQVRLRTADFYPARTVDLARQLGIEAPKQMPVWAEAKFSLADCKRKPGSLVSLCTANNVTVTFKDYLEKNILGSVTGSVEFAIDTFTRDSLTLSHPEGPRVDATLTVTVSGKAYRRAAVAEMAAQYCNEN
jgi:hypothetical protein